MSCFVTRPAYPLPGIREISTLCSAAILQTCGVDFVSRRCSAVWTPPPSPLLTGVGACGLGGGGWGLGAWARGGGGAGGTVCFGGSGLGAAGAVAAAGFDATAPASV